MQVHIGRLIDHIHLRTRDLEAASRFYAAVLDVLGIPYVADDTHFQADELWIDAVDAYPGGQSHVHLAFQAKDRATVEAAYKAALAAGGKDNGAPGERDYHPGYYGAFFLDPDGNNIEAVFHGPSERSAESVTITSV
ncbi:VOC family protein [Phenylobacterium sp.]|uniref:VOC family protein n=1 Tax=Phenylobacterium sp. TaxID=1871053 RepID=UPI002B59C406|nr:VOC family protein [Phenylobacterium sp.]HVI32165.1 VOC family protein [Phenylobacterium sp.]